MKQLFVRLIVPPFAEDRGSDYVPWTLGWEAASSAAEDEFPSDMFAEAERMLGDDAIKALWGEYMKQHPLPEGEEGDWDCMDYFDAFFMGLEKAGYVTPYNIHSVLVLEYSTTA